MYVNRPKKTLKVDFTASQGKLFRLSPLRPDGSRNSQKRAGPCERRPKAQTKLAQRGPKARVHSVQMVLVMTRREAGTYERQT